MSDIITAALVAGTPLSAADRLMLANHVSQLLDGMLAARHAAAVGTRALQDTAALLADDGHAATFQSFGQYRTSIIQFIAHRQEAL